MKHVIKRYLPFRPDMATAVQAGHKTVTSRTIRYGNEGDILLSDAGDLRLVRLIRRSLDSIARDLYAQEGFNSPDEFRQAWAALHPRVGFRGDQLVWVHVFERVA